MMTLADYLRQWDRRLRLEHSLTWGLRGLAAGLLAAVFIASAARIWPLHALAGLWGATLAPAGLLIALTLVWLWPRPALAQARFFDRCLGLQERISTALEISQGNITLPDWMAQEQLANALHAAQKADPAAALPLRLAPRDWLPAALSLALLAAAIWLPNPMQDILVERAAVRQAIQEQVEELEAIREEIAADPQLSKADREALLEALDGSIERLGIRDLTREEALAELTETGERLRELTSAETEQKAAGLNSAAGGLKDSPITSALAEALLNEDYQLAAAILQDLSNDLGEQLTQELDLAEQLAQAAAELGQSNPELAGQLAQAAQAMPGDIAAAREALAQASQTISQTGRQVAASRAAQQAAGQMVSSGQQVAQAGGQSGQDGQGGEGPAKPAGPMQPDNGPGDGGLREFEPIYAPQRIGGTGGPEMELPQGSDPGELVRELGSNPEIGRSTVPYNQVYVAYADAANQALEEQHIPLGLRGYVRNYFSALEP